MKIYQLVLSLFLAFLINACTNNSSENNATENATNDTIQVTLAMVEESWINERVNSARERLRETPAGKKIWSSIEAHGGLEDWFSKGPISFHFDYKPLDGGTRRNSYQIVDQWSVRAVHEVADNRDIKYGWDGEQAWSYPDTAQVSVNPRFWSTTPYYFIGLPFVLADEGVILEDMGLREFKGNTYELVKATYKDGVGDASDDFYIIYIDQDTKLMGALRYIVSYPGFFPDGGHAPEKFMEILAMQSVDGIKLPTGYHTFWFKNDQPAEHITEIDVTEISFEPETPNSYFDAPKGAKIQEGY